MLLAQTAATHVATGWEEFAKLWGPAIPMFFVVLYYLHRAVFLVVPRGFRSLRKALQFEGQAAERRHNEAMTIMRRVEDKLDAIPLCKKSAHRRQPP